MKSNRQIIESIRLETGIKIIEAIAANAQSVRPKKHWFELNKAVCEIYRIAHTISSPKCRKNHKDWLKKLDADINKF